MRAAVVVGVVAVVGVLGCAKKILKPPTEAFVELAGKRASYRQWARAEDLCRQDPAVFKGDLDSMNALLAAFLERTSAGLQGSWGQEQIGILEDGQVLLPPALSLEAASIEAAVQAGCGFEGLAQAKELNALAQKRLDQAPDLLKVAKAKVALAQWKETHPAQEARAREAQCTNGSKAPVLFHACEDEASRLEWQFCDGAKVVASPGNVPAFQAPPPPAVDPKAKKAKKPPKLPAPELYLEAASKYPSADVARAPKIPKIVPTKKDDGAPEPDGF
ncbi:MAG: hypothetical protein AB1938_29600 [Myxococcota bacterium]